jgi:hypothetical protein
MWIWKEPIKTNSDPDPQHWMTARVSRRATTRPYCIVIAREEAFFLPESNTALQDWINIF